MEEVLCRRDPMLRSMELSRGSPTVTISWAELNPSNGKKKNKLINISNVKYKHLNV